MEDVEARAEDPEFAELNLQSATWETSQLWRHFQGVKTLLHEQRERLDEDRPLEKLKRKLCNDRFEEGQFLQQVLEAQYMPPEPALDLISESEWPARQDLIKRGIDTSSTLYKLHHLHFELQERERLDREMRRLRDQSKKQQEDVLNLKRRGQQKADQMGSLEDQMRKLVGTAKRPPSAMKETAAAETQLPEPLATILSRFGSVKEQGYDRRVTTRWAVRNAQERIFENPVLVKVAEVEVFIQAATDDVGISPSAVRLSFLLDPQNGREVRVWTDGQRAADYGVPVPSASPGAASCLKEESSVHPGAFIPEGEEGGGYRKYAWVADLLAGKITPLQVVQNIRKLNGL